MLFLEKILVNVQHSLYMKLMTTNLKLMVKVTSFSHLSLAKNG